jgi:translocation and assembly module TamB
VTAPSSRSVRVALLLAALLVAGGVLALRSHLAWEQLCTLARRELPKVVGADIGIGRCEVDPAARTVRLGGVSV